MVATSVRIVALPGSAGFVQGLYGLEASAVRGLVRIERNEGSERAASMGASGGMGGSAAGVSSTGARSWRGNSLSSSSGSSSSTVSIGRLRVTLRGVRWARFVDSVDALDVVRREAILFERAVDLLVDTILLLPASSASTSSTSAATTATHSLDIPFELPFPPHDPVGAGFGPAPQLLPPSCSLSGLSATLDPYSAAVEYSLTATLTESYPPAASSQPQSQPVQTNAQKSSLPASPRLSLASKASIDFASTLSAIGLANLFAPPPISCTVSLDPFLTYDPRMIPLIMHPDPRRWRSAPGAIPAEYDFEVGSIALGPNDTLRFAYRLVVNSESARQGVRVHKVTFSLKETHIIGEDRCCALDDRTQSFLLHKQPARVKGSKELLHWENVEYSAMSAFFSSRNSKSAAQTPPAASARASTSRNYQNENSNYAPALDTSDDPSSFELMRLREPSKSIEPLLRPGTRGGAGDGIYVETEAMLRIPPLGSFTPTTPKLIIPDDDHICKKVRPRKALIQVRHSIQVTLDFIGADRITIESGVYLLPVGHDECARILEEDPEILPSLDYDKIVGIEVWVPEYAPRDPVFADPENASDATPDQTSSSRQSFHECATEVAVASGEHMRDHDQPEHPQNHHADRDQQRQLVQALAPEAYLQWDEDSTDAEGHSNYADAQESLAALSLSDTHMQASVESTVPDSPVPRYEDVVTTPPLLDIHKKKSLLVRVPSLSSLQGSLSYAMTGSNLPNATASAEPGDTAIEPHPHATPLSTHSQTTLSPWDPLRRFAMEPHSIVPIEQAIAEAMMDSIVMDVRSLNAESASNRVASLQSETRHHRQRRARHQSAPGTSSSTLLTQGWRPAFGK